MRFVGLEGEVLVAESEQVLHRAIEAHAGEGPRRASELLAGLLEVIEVKVGVAESEDELARLESRYLRHHQREQRIPGDVAPHAHNYAAPPLVHLPPHLALPA